MIKRDKDWHDQFVGLQHNKSMQLSRDVSSLRISIVQRAADLNRYASSNESD